MTPPSGSWRTTRVAVFTALERLTPTGLRDYRTGDLLGRLVDDVDGLQDLYLRIAVPVAAGSTVGLLTVVGIGWASPLAGVRPASVWAWLVAWSRGGALAPEPRAAAAGSAARSEPGRGAWTPSRAAPTCWPAVPGPSAGRLDRIDGRLSRATRAEARVAGPAAAYGHLASGATCSAAS